MTPVIAPLVEIEFDGLLRCSRYSFGPNRLHYCGPEANREIFDYIQNGASDAGLEKIMRAFRTLYPYLRLIAQSNKIKNPFNDRVVQAYWVGNELLENVERRALYRNMIEEHRLKQKIGLKSFSRLEQKIRQYAVPHHSFHVLNVWRRTGNLDKAQTLESMDSCRVSWGPVKEIDGPHLTVEVEPLLEQNGKLMLGTATRKRILRCLETSYELEQLKPDDIITIHWDVPCEVITPKQASVLRRYTLKSIALANQGV